MPPKWMTNNKIKNKHKEPVKPINEQLDIRLKQLCHVSKRIIKLESTKISRNLKNAQTKSSEGQPGSETSKTSQDDMDKLLEQVKNLDSQTIANYVLYSTINKKQDLKSDERVQEWLGEKFKEPLSKIDPTTPHGKAFNRILSAKAITQVANQEFSSSKKKSKQKKEKKQSKTAQQDVTSNVTGKRKREEEEVVEHDNDDIDAAEAQGGFFEGENENEHKNEYDQEGDGESDRESDEEQQLTGSTFLSTLASNYIAPDSDSEVEDFSGDDIPQKKNRKGQRERRAIAERKYGRNAKHLQKEREKQEEIRQKRMQRQQKRQERHEQFQQTKVQQERQNANKAIKRNDNKKDYVHPSWQARKSQVEQASLGVAGGIATGKKIVFGD